MDALRYFESIHAGHMNVQQYQCKRVCRRRRRGGASPAPALHCALKQAAFPSSAVARENSAIRRVVIHDQDRHTGQDMVSVGKTGSRFLAGLKHAVK